MTDQIKLSGQQEEAVKAVRRWIKAKDKPFFYLAGFAGVGKTYLARLLAANVKGPVYYGAFTGKAAQVMRSKGCEGARTIHSMIYRAEEDEAGNTAFVLDYAAKISQAALIVIDEVSMVGEELAHDLLSFGRPVLVLGDPAQLPPVKGAAYFTAGEPDFMLTEIHRQAIDNPIIRLSMEVRQGKQLQFGEYGESRVVSRKAFDGKDATRADQILVGLNRTRERYNARMREILGFSDTMPQVGDRLVCLANHRELSLWNGSLWNVAKLTGRSGPGIGMQITPEMDPSRTDPVKVDAHFLHFEGRANDIDKSEFRKYQHFTYGYALTVHKSQGSQWDDVCLFDESGSFRQDKSRHLYTAITRAAERITIVI